DVCSSDLTGSAVHRFLRRIARQDACAKLGLSPYCAPGIPDEESIMNPLLLRLAAGAVVWSLGASLAVAQSTTPPASTDTKSDPVVAVVNGKTLKRSDVVASAQTLPAECGNQVDQLLPLLGDRLSVF